MRVIPVLWLTGLSLLASVTVRADRVLELSSKKITAETSEVLVVHEHDVKRREVGTPRSRRQEIVLELNSTLRVIRKADSAVLLDRAVMPLTALVSTDDGRYFVGLSSLRALSAVYNFILLSPQGEILATALVTPDSGHCQSVSWTVTNAIRWFDEEQPGIRVVEDDGRPTEVVVENPYDRRANGTSGTCTIPVGDNH